MVLLNYSWRLTRCVLPWLKSLSVLPSSRVPPFPNRTLGHRRFFSEKHNLTETPSSESVDILKPVNAKDRSTSLISEPFVTVTSSRDNVAGDENQESDDRMWDPSNQIVTQYDPDERLLLARGKNGVFEIEELVELVEDKGAYDICVMAVPKEMKYVDYMVIVTGRSPKHMQAVANFIRHAFKRKNLRSTDLLPTIEGGKYEREWVALDLGNIALHVMMPEKRDEVDLETLWLVGPDYDDLTHQKVPTIIQMLENFTVSDDTDADIVDMTMTTDLSTNVADVTQRKM